MIKGSLKYVVVLMMLCGMAFAAPWATVYDTTIIDAPGTDGMSFGSGQDIYSGSYGQDAFFWYFKMEMVGAIAGSSSTNYAYIYGLYFDTNPNQSVSGINYIPSSLSGIDTIPDLHFTGNTTDAWIASSHYHQYESPTSLTDTLISAVDADSFWDGNNVIEWRIAKTLLPSWTTLTMGTHADSFGLTHDLLVVPEPATLALLGLGMLGLRKKK